MSFGIGLTPDMEDALAGGAALYLFAEIDHPDGVVHLWNGVGDVEWNGDTYSGKGALGWLSAQQQSTDLHIQDRVMTIRGVDPAELAFLTGNVRGRDALFWLGCLDRWGRVVPDPFVIDEIVMDSQTFPVSDRGEASIQIRGFSGLWTLERAQNIAWSTEEAKLTYPDETGFDMIPTLVNVEVKWKKN